MIMNKRCRTSPWSYPPRIPYQFHGDILFCGDNYDDNKLPSGNSIHHSYGVDGPFTSMIYPSNIPKNGDFSVCKLLKIAW